MATRNAKPVTFKEGPDDFAFLMFRINREGKLEVMLRQNAHESEEVAEAVEGVAKIPGVDSKELRKVLDGIVSHLRGKAGIL